MGFAYKQNLGGAQTKKGSLLAALERVKFF
jgi:hypothetical protein